MKTAKQKAVKIAVDNPIMAYTFLRSYGVECLRIEDYVIVNEANYQASNNQNKMTPKHYTLRGHFCFSDETDAIELRIV